MRVALAIAAMIAVPISAAADEPPAPPPTPTSTSTTSGPTFAPGGVPLPPSTAPGNTPAPAASTVPPPGTATPGDTPGADPAYRGTPDPDVRTYRAPRSKDVVIVAYPERSKSNLIMLGALGGGGVVLGAVGLYFHLDSRSASSDVASHKPTGQPWTADKQDTYDRAHRSSVIAGVFYGVGGALVLATAVAYIITEPKAETMTIHPHTASALVAPTRGGAIVGGTWSF